MNKLFQMLIFLLCITSTGAYASEQTIRISTSYKTCLSNPEQTGMLDRILKEAFQRIGIHAEVVFTPNVRSLVAVNDGMFDCEINRIAGMEKNFPNLVQVPEPNMTMHFVAFATKEIPISNWESLRSLRIGIEKGWKILEQNTKGLPHVTHVLNADQLFNMLHSERIDIALYSEIGGYEWISKLKCDRIIRLNPPLASRDMFLYLHKKHKALAEPVARALREMKRDGSYDRIVNETIGSLH